MQHYKALDIAIKLLKKLEDVCTKVDIAGSVRREKPEVKDIEICCCPAVLIKRDLFGEYEGTFRINEFIHCVNSMGTILKGDPAKGRYVQIKLPEGIILDLFIPQEADYYRQLSIRIGPSEYSHKVLATAWNKKGWVGTENGLRLEKECYSKQVGIVNGRPKFIHVCNVDEPTLPPVWENEWEFFNWLGLSWQEPKNRNV